MSWPWITLFCLQWAVLLALLVVVLGLNQRVIDLWAAVRPSSPMHLERLPPTGQSLPLSSPLAALGTGNRIFMFVGSECPPCRELRARLAADPAETLRALNDTSLFMVTDAAGESFFSIPGVNTVVLDDGAIKNAVGVHATPTGIAVDSAGVVRGSSPANNLQHVSQLADRFSTPVAAV